MRSGLRERYRRDVDPPQSDVGKYIANDMGIDGYRCGRERNTKEK